MRAFWRRLVAQRLPTYNGQTTATAVEMREGPAMAKMTAVQKKAFLKRMSAGRAKAGKASTGRAKAGRITGRKVTRNAGAASMVAKAGAGSTAGYYEIVDRLGRNDLVGRGNKFRSRKSAAKALASLRRDKSEDYTNFKIRHVRSAERGAGGMVKRRAGSAAMPARKGRQSGAMGSGAPMVRLQRVEGAIMDLARANHAVVSKVVEHERRLNSVESTLSDWAKGRR